VIDVGGQIRVRFGIVVGFAQEDLVDGLRGRLDAPRASEIFLEGLPDEVPEGHPSRPGDLGGTPVKVRRQQELGPVHV
jgi:hypothetical protein